MSPVHNGSSVVRRFECRDVIEICDGIINFYMGLPHVLPKQNKDFSFDNTAGMLQICTVVALPWLQTILKRLCMS